IKKALKDSNGCQNDRKSEFVNFFLFNDTFKNNLLRKYLDLIAFERL
ncbi:hypothetical protein M153_14890001, partial [Pseudoloma neurophilia]